MQNSIRDRRSFPNRLKSLVKCLMGKEEKPNFAHYLRESTEPIHLGNPGAEVENIFKKVAHVPGWFNVDDCLHFLLVLRMQSHLGVHGDLFEIGSFHGRSTSVMASALRIDEKIVVCDAFEGDTEDSYENKPTEERLLRNIRNVVSGIRDDQIRIHKCLSQDIALPPEQVFRFVHIDGGHAAEQAYRDLKLCDRHLIDGGIMVIDDYGHPKWPGVKTGTDRFISEHSDYRIMADLNRHGAKGRKLYLAKSS